jgi:methionine sulfoxide reductase heme-binding subunit
MLAQIVTATKPKGFLDGPALWYLNRGTGVVLLVLFTLSIVLGVLATTRRSSRWWPRFLTQGLHRNLSLIALVLVIIHAATAVIDTFVDIRWWQAIIPFGATYKPWWLGLGTLSFDVMLAVIITSLFRDRIKLKVWRWIHFSSYAVFALGVIHGLGIGTDRSEFWSVVVTSVCVLAVALVGGYRIVAVRANDDPTPARPPRRPYRPGSTHQPRPARADRLTARGRR